MSLHYKLQSWTKAVETLPEKDLFRWTREFFNFQFSYFDSLSPFSVVLPRDSVHGMYFNIEKGESTEREGLAIHKKDVFWNYGRTLIEICPWF